MDDPLQKYPGYVLRRASACALADLNKRLKRLDLRHADIALLLLLEAKPGITQSQAGRILDIARANMAPFVARIEKKKFIRRSAVDGRSQKLELTRQGQVALVQGKRIVNNYEQELIERVPVGIRDLVLPMLLALWRGG